MYTKKLIDDVIEMLLFSPRYKNEIMMLSKDEQRAYATSLLDKIVVSPPMYSDATIKHLINLDSGDQRTVSNLIGIVEAYLGITPQTIVKMDKELVRPNEDAKTCFLDNLYCIDDGTYLDIETQSKLSSSKQLMNKNLLYQASVITELSRKGNNATKYNNVINLCIYEGIYKGDWEEGVVDDMNDHIKCYQPIDIHYGLDSNVNQKLVIVELGKINKIVLNKGIDYLNSAESISYVIKNMHLIDIDEETRKNIEILKRKEKVIRDMVDMRNEYLGDPLYQIALMKDYLERSTERMEGIIEDQEVQRQKYYQRVLKRFKMKYDEDSIFLKDLSLEAYEYIDDLIFENASFDEIKDYVKSLK
ncbi:MAG: Rpn family recombination-promoting nuclease/putative transposase [Erysipelotrichaceae bacterium]|nr:Rpn family recombination-promoting nuclease/putative transposase [Erysipelotrichaceae bacterium]